MIDPKRALLSHAIGPEIVRRAAAVLAPPGIPVMPLKGVWLQACAYGPTELRVITDVDLLVPEAAFADAVAHFQAAGWRERSSNVSEVALEHDDALLPIDLHRRLFTRGAFGLSTQAMFRRSHPDQTVFGVRVYMPDPRDVLGHLIGHFVKSRASPKDPIRLADFTAVARRCALGPRDCARHLHAVGMARAARYVLAELARDDPFYAELVDRLPRDRLARPLVCLARAAGSWRDGRSLLGAAPGFLLDRTLPSGARALVLRALDVRKDRRGPHVRRRSGRALAVTGARS